MIKILDAIRFHCGGRAKAKMAHEIIGIMNATISEREFRHEVEKLVEEGALIGSHPNKGYWYIFEQKDLDEAVDYFERQVHSMVIRKNRLIANYKEKNKEYNGQRELI